ncbi:hypothetical protein B0H16DRAFT_1692058 [Mycena metata]|uniref:Uncharacterized protein n=1 Tax=Mycena metata TaxID=1033252 RepID=A0AAD7IQT9_9AGAR|nr:hypothetical protein B0H16DRAFT_1692058 [Mycena metata]
MSIGGHHPQLLDAFILSCCSETNPLTSSGPTTICPATDAKLVDSAVSGKFKTCTYDDAGICTILPSCACSNSTPEVNAAASLQGDQVLATSDSGPSDDQGTFGFSPMAIALLVLNVVLLTINLILATMLIRAPRRRIIFVPSNTLYERGWTTPGVYLAAKLTSLLQRRQGLRVYAPHTWRIVFRST